MHGFLVLLKKRRNKIASSGRTMNSHVRHSPCQILLSVLLMFVILLNNADCVFTKDRVIDEAPMTIKVVTGQLALLPCSVDPKYTEQFADEYKVMWVSPEDTAISLQDRRILNDMRISVERPFLKDWNLHIRNVSLTDAGMYKCQINTVPVGTKKVHLVVEEPPRIIDYSNPSDVEKPEGEMVELFCNATGVPRPEITWYRLNKKGNGIKERVGFQGESLVIHNISRVCADHYECHADNKVPPAMSQTFKVTVLYPPEVTLPNSRLGQHAGKDTVLECEVSASPLGSVIWKHNGKSLVGKESHEVTLYNSNPEHVILSLRIVRVEAPDFGIYVCEASNGLGTRSESMELYELATKTPPTTTSSSTITTSKHIWITRHPNGDVKKVNGPGRVTSPGMHANQELPANDRQPNFNRPITSQDGALRADGQDHRSKYTGIIANDGEDGTGSANFLEHWGAWRLLLTSLLTTTIIHLVQTS